MRVLDRHRAMIYGPSLEKAFSQACGILNSLPQVLICGHASKILKPWAEGLAEELDELLLPSLAAQIFKVQDTLTGDTSEERYRSFFTPDRIQHLLRTENGTDLSSKLLLYSSTAAEALCTCLQALAGEKEQLRTWLGTDPRLLEVGPGLGDRHNNGRRVLRLSFSEVGDVFYKPRSASGEQALSSLVEYFYGVFHYPATPLDLRTHSWHRRCLFEEIESTEQAGEYWKSAGMLMALLDTFNFTDGHYENVIARKVGPIVIDAETMFHNFRYILGANEERSILYTGLLQRRTTEAGELGPMAAFQIAGGARRSETRPTAVNDRTDRLKVSFTRLFTEPGVNYPILGDSYASLEKYFPHFASGLSVGYTCLSEKRRTFLDSSLWLLIKTLKTRQLLRLTKFYSLLIRKAQQPRCAISGFDARRVVSESLTINSAGFVPDVPFLPDPSLAMACF